MKIALLLTMSAATVLCQQAQISGIIQDPAGSRVSGAVISVRSEDTGGQRVTESNREGFYSVVSLRPGTYRIAIAAMGFQTIAQEGVKLEVGDNARLDFEMRIGDMRTVITVNGAPPLVNTDDASVGTLIGRNIIDKMPLNGRGIQSLIELTPGLEATPVTTNNSGQFTVNGQRSDANYFTVDGVSANIAAGVVSTSNAASPAIIQAIGATLPANNLLGTFSNLVSPDALQEFKIQTSTFAPEFGRAPGAQIDLATRSGAARYSGSLFEYVRNDIFDANDWFNNQLGRSKSPLRFNNFGATLGGPLKVPRVFESLHRTFFFFSFEDLVLRQPQPVVPFLVPDAQIRISASPLAASLYKALPLPNLPGVAGYSAPTPGWGGYAQGFSAPTDQQTCGLRLDHSFSDKLFGFLRYNRSPSNVTNYYSYQPLTAVESAADTRMLTFGLTFSAKSTLVNDVRVSFSRQDVTSGYRFLSLGGAQKPSDAVWLPPGSSAQNSIVNVVDLGFPAIPPILVGNPTLENVSRQFQVVNKLSYVRGSHQWKFGADYRLFRLFLVSPRTNTLYTFSDLSTGIASKMDVYYSRNVTYEVPAFSLYAQDTWHASQRLTLTYGVRWELAPAPRASNGPVPVYPQLTSQQLASLANLTPAPPGTPFYRTQYGAIAPRLGLAWQVGESSLGKTVLRLGAGVFYDPGQSFFATSSSAFASNTYINVPFGTFPSNGPTTQYSGFSAIALAGYTLPRTYEWNVTIAQSLGQQTISAGYVGSLGRRLTGISFDLEVPQNVYIVGDPFSSSYNSLQLQFNRKLSKRIQALLSYTWSHSIDNLSTAIGAGTSPSLAFLEHPDLNRGSSDFDVRQSIHGAVFASLPAPHRGSFAPLLQDWTASSIFFVRSAPPTDVLISHNGSLVRPDVVPGQPFYLYGVGFPGGMRYNPAAFTEPRSGALQGDLGRNVLRGFGAWQFDLAMHRQFKLTERVGLQFRVEAFNLFNHPNFANPSRSAAYPSAVRLGVSSFGLSQRGLASGLSPTGTLGGLNPLFQIGGPRVFQFALRLAF